MDPASGDPLRLVDDDEDARIAVWALELERSRWPGYVVDRELKLRFASSELKVFLGMSLGREVDDEAAGVGTSILDAISNEAWSAAITPDSLTRVMPRLFGYLKEEFGSEEARQIVPEPMLPFLEGAGEDRTFGVVSDNFEYTVPGLPPLVIEFLLIAMRGASGEFLGGICVTQMGIRPTLVSLLARGDERMFERMADLQEPRRCQGAVLFADLEGSSRLSRLLPTGTYFSLVRSLATQADMAIAANDGVVGRHAGDGVSGYFLVSEGVDASGVAAAAITTARTIQAAAEGAIAEVVRELDIDASDFRMNVGVHWGASIFMGQLVPGGRLDITALGDSVNECARIEEAATGGALLASKQLVEQLSMADALSVGVDPDQLVYRTVADLAPDSAKAVRDAGLIAVTRLD